MTDWAASVITGNTFAFPAGCSPPTINFDVFTGPVTNKFSVFVDPFAYSLTCAPFRTLFWPKFVPASNKAIDPGPRVDVFLAERS